MLWHHPVEVLKFLRDIYLGIGLQAFVASSPFA
jgi:hypothetical protein